MSTFRNSSVAANTLAYGFVLGGALIMLAPFYFMFVFATHSDREILSLPPPLWFGDQFLTNVQMLAFGIALLGLVLLLILPAFVFFGVSGYDQMNERARGLLATPMVGNGFSRMFPGR